MKPKPKTKSPAPVQLELFTIEPRPKKLASWPTPSGSCYRLRARLVDGGCSNSQRQQIAAVRAELRQYT